MALLGKHAPDDPGELAGSGDDRLTRTLLPFHRSISFHSMIRHETVRLMRRMPMNRPGFAGDLNL